MAYTEVLDPTVPGNLDDVSEGAGNIRDLKRDLIERLETLIGDIDTDPLALKAALHFLGSFTQDSGTAALQAVTATTFTGTGAAKAPQICQSSGIANGVLNTGVVDITIPTRVLLRLEILESGNMRWRVYYVVSSGASTAAVTSLVDGSAATLAVAGVDATTVRITNSTGGTVNVSWALINAMGAL